MKNDNGEYGGFNVRDYREYEEKESYPRQNHDYGEIIAANGVNNDKSSFWFAFLAFWSPLFGIILYLVYEDKKPLRAQSLKNGIIVGIVTRIVLITLVFLLDLVPNLKLAKQTNELYDAVLSDYYDSLLNS